MEGILRALQPFLPAEVYQEDAGYDVYELFDNQTEEQIGMYSVNKEGVLNSFSLDGEAPAGNLSKDELLVIANRFIEVFLPEKRKEYELSSIIDLDNPYMISFEKRDQKYGLFLHSTGFTISVSTTGQVRQFFYEEEEYEVVYPEQLISEKEALETYMKHVHFELAIMEFDSETFKNGDNQFHLAYTVHEQAYDVPADGRKPELFIEQFELETIPHQNVPHEELYDLLGFSSKYRKTEVLTDENKRMEAWSTRQDGGPASWDMEEVTPHMVKLGFDQKSGQLLQVTNGMPAEANGSVIGMAAARKRAIEVLFKLYPDAHLRFQMSELNEEYGIDEYEYPEDPFYVKEDMAEEDETLEEELDCGVDIELEDTYIFYFHLMKDGIPVSDCVSLIGIGKWTGRVCSFQLNVIDEAVYQHRPTTPTISLSEAESIYLGQLKMELRFVREYDENQKTTYTLSYGPEFPKTVAHVRAIDALTGEPMIVEVGDAVFYD